VEHYDPSKPVCDNQADYNRAFRAALKYNRKQNVKDAGNWVLVYLIIHVIFLFWALMLAAKVQPGPYRTMHMVFALLFSPAYVLAHYIGMLNSK
jgi:NO-binding membrane sensor protein with MHYT domain